jgi:hypothetical protein
MARTVNQTSRPHRRTLPDWAAVQRAEDAGVTLLDLWREYAATAPQPYVYCSFQQEFRNWQSSTSVEPAAEYVASEHHWRGKAHPRPDILVLGDGAALRIRGGHLEAYSLGVTQHFAPGPHHRKPKAVIFAGWGGLLSLSAVHFCIDHHITILAAGYLGDLTTFVAPCPIQDAALVRAQCAAKPAPVAREIVLQKFRHYLATSRMSRANSKPSTLGWRRPKPFIPSLTSKPWAALLAGFIGKACNSSPALAEPCHHGLPGHSGTAPAASDKAALVTRDGRDQRHVEPLLCA